MSTQMSVFSGLVTAVREIFSDMRSEINELIYRQLDDRKIQYQKGFDFYGLTQNIIRKSIPDEDMREEVLQDILVHTLARVDGQSIFDLYEPGKASNLERWYYTSVYRRVLNALERMKREQRERPTDYQPGEDNPWGIDRLPQQAKDLDESDYKELVSDLTKTLSQHRLGDTLVKVFNMLVEGWSKPDIVEALGFKSASRLSYYIKELQNEVKEYIIQKGDDNLARALAKALGEAWD